VTEVTREPVEKMAYRQDKRCSDSGK
jgi:hypothetical protein